MGHKVKQSLMSSRIDFFYYAFRNVLLVSVPLLVVSGVILSHLSFHSSAYSSSTDSVSLSLPTSCTISANVLTPHNATLVNGQYEGNIGNTRINAYCNDNNGYFIYAIGSGNDTDGNTDLVSSINDNYNIHTNVYNSSTITANTPSSWAMKLTGSNGAYAPTIVDGYSNYNLIPSTDTIVAYRTSGTSMDLDTDLTGSYFNTTYEIYTNPIQPAGTYLGKVKYTMTHPYDSQLTTIEKAFDVAGKDKVQVTDPITGETGNYYKMQDMSSRICSLTATYETEEKLVDIRDNKLYYVSKLKDGHCWMTQNLDLEIDTTRTYTHNDTDLGWDPDSFDTNATWAPDTTNGKYNLPVNGTSVPGWSNQNNYPYSADPGDVYYYTSNSTSDDIKYTSLSNCTSAGHTEGECKHYHAGNYYNWTAAIASNNSANANNVTGEVAMSSICPKGWRLPNASQTDNEYNEFGRMFYEAGITAALANGNNSVNYKNGGFNELRSGPYYFVRSGGVGGNLDGPGAAGRYWSGVISGNGSSYTLYFDSSQITPSNSLSWGWGRSIRCLAR